MALPVEGQLALGALVDGVIVKANVHTGLFAEDFFAISADLQVSVRDITVGEGFPASWGLNHSDYNVGEVAEHIDVSLLGRGSKIEQERLRRLVRNGGQFEFNSASRIGFIPMGPSRRIPLRFMIQEGFALEIWHRNRSGATMTTGAQLEWHGTVYGRWVT